ncbi:ABC transporter ATP-binding protein [Streptomyces xinghaiensis]|uniref:ABC transporter ATP-binding protein n=1 Tax=Streptomyces xinghaiensis TaxID=1038928 RepID=UPI002E0DB2E2|nr:ABC transporter ATP-binding protein [Streptomyces xinghaiensis]
MLDVQGLRKTYTARGRTVEAVRDLTFHIAPGELVCLVGPSGCGKTTLLKCMAGLLAPTGGEVLLRGRPVTGPPEGMAVVLQEYGRSLFAWMNVHDNVGLPLRRKKMSKARREELVDHALELVGLSDARDAYPWQLSGGMQQRVAIARAVAYEPQVLLMDEPFAAVDAQTRAELEDLIRRLWHELGVTVLFVTHDIDEAVYLGQKTIILSKSPTVVQEELVIDLPDERDQLHTRSSARFGELRAHVYEQIQRAKNGAVAETGTGTGTGEHGRGAAPGGGGESGESGAAGEPGESGGSGESGEDAKTVKSSGLTPESAKS